MFSTDSSRNTNYCLLIFSLFGAVYELEEIKARLAGGLYTVSSAPSLKNRVTFHCLQEPKSNNYERSSSLEGYWQVFSGEKNHHVQLCSLDTQ
jgi:hypothetical protein